MKNSFNKEQDIQYIDIQEEIKAYLEFNPNVFRGKTVLILCQYAEISNFTKYFISNFQHLGLRKLISVCANIENEITNGRTKKPSFKRIGKILAIERNESGLMYTDKLQWQDMKGNGDFRSEEVSKIRDEAEVIVTNPPYSKFREFLTWIVEGNKKFIIIGSINCVIALPLKTNIII